MAFRIDQKDCCVGHHYRLGVKSQSNQEIQMHILVTIIIGFFAGLIAKMLMPGRDPGGFLVTTLLGIAGAFVAKYLGIALNIYQPGDAVGFLAAIVGAVIILAVYHLFRRGRAVAP
jgi:uncharacterized membrane protein YeaQ/YmgE (transglycosylase-associated protein family)